MSGGWGALTRAAAAGAARLRAAWAAPEAAQRAALAELLRANAGTAFGREHGFADIDDVATFRRRVPIRDHDGHRRWIDRVAAGEANVLTADPVLCLEETSGATSAAKLIPYTQALLDDFRAAALPWLDAALAHGPQPPRGTLYVALSPATRAARASAGGVPIGLPSDAAYLGPQLGAALLGLLAVPPELGALADVTAWRRATLAALVGRRDLAIVSIWSPTFFEALLDALPQDAEALAPDLAPEPRARLARALAGGRLDARALWPDLALVSCWTDGPSAVFARRLAERLPGVRLHPKGLLATEAAVTTPLRLDAAQEARAPALLGGFLEFIDEAGAARGAHELAEGRAYRVVVTTSGGLARYDLGDRVVCAGFAVAAGLRAPHLSFLGRERTSDLVGEKLSEVFAAQALAALPVPAALRPVHAPAPLYTLLVEADDAAFAREGAAWAATVEARLAANPHYAHARAMGQLAALRVEAVARLADHHPRGEARLAMVKPRALLTMER